MFKLILLAAVAVVAAGAFAVSLALADGGQVPCKAKYAVSVKHVDGSTSRYLACSYSVKSLFLK